MPGPAFASASPMPPPGAAAGPVEAEVAAPAGIVYGLLADAARRPLYFPSAVHVERLGSDGVRDELLVWSRPAGPPGSGDGIVLVSERRELDAARRRVGCAAGTWQVEACAADRSRLTLTGGRAGAWEDVRELLALAAHWERLDDVMLTFEDVAEVAAPPAVTYACFADRVAGRWPYRVLLPASGRIVGKRPQPPDGPLAAHTGCWRVDADGLARVRHSVVLRPAALRALPGAPADLGAARRIVREALGRQSRHLLAAVRRAAQEAAGPRS
ncbi:hypothetical protein [Streptomyces sp. WAC06614]|uniref:hypothetical protein n=1 Tax=Streptomyces sp. WAC06614 TaxID=2487416 RepID=UPI000F797E69|nr:hypothetical protein [Streptomyces sp. WAC06614]RSS83381.1 hypothetical protein EF918_03845 [Streptomyces sp. WAC06614]